MLRKLRRKFIAITMSLVTAVLLAVFVIMCVTQYTGLRDMVNTALSQAMYIRMGFELRPVISSATVGNVSSVFVTANEAGITYGADEGQFAEVTTKTARLITGAKLGASPTRIFIIGTDGSVCEFMNGEELRPVGDDEFDESTFDEAPPTLAITAQINPDAGETGISGIAGAEGGAAAAADGTASFEQVDAGWFFSEAAAPVEFVAGDGVNDYFIASVQGTQPDAVWGGAIRTEAFGGDTLTKYRAAAQIPAFWVIVSTAGDIISSRNNVSISDEELGRVVRLALESEEESGNINQFSLRYMKREEPNGDIRIAYADRTAELEGMRSVIVNSLIIGIPALFVLFLISLFLSSWAMKPVSDAWNRQRRFVSDASHELKTPLTVILANMGLMLSHTEDKIGSHIQWADNTRIEALRMKSLVEDLLSLAAADAHREAPRREEINLSDAAWNAVLSFEPVAFEQGTQIECGIDPDITAITDGVAASQIMTILLDNAVKYAGSGGSVSVTLQAIGGRPELVVTNTGEGISEEDLPHIFERFYRADPSRAEGGFGLGLAIAAELAELNGYKIDAESGGEGAMFTVRF